MTLDCDKPIVLSKVISGMLEKLNRGIEEAEFDIRTLESKLTAAKQGLHIMQENKKALENERAKRT